MKKPSAHSRCSPSIWSPRAATRAAQAIAAIVSVKSDPPIAQHSAPTNKAFDTEQHAQEAAQRSIHS
ncbi:hypothetical protein Dimus_023049, partial [Dionaea muscipula]